MLIFDRGTLFLFPTSPGQPVIRFGSLENVELTFDFELKAVRTQLQVPVKFTRGLTGIHGKAKAANIDGALFGQFLFTQVASAGSKNVTLDKSVTLSGATPQYATTNFWADLGVVNTATGAKLIPSTWPVDPNTIPTGYYSVDATNTYRFSPSDTGKTMLVSYASQDSTGKTVALTNPWMDLAKPFGIFLNTRYDCKQASLWLPACVSKQLTLPTKLEGFAISEFAFEAQQDSTGNAGEFSFAE